MAQPRTRKDSRWQRIVSREDWGSSCYDWQKGNNEAALLLCASYEVKPLWQKINISESWTDS